MPIDSEGKRRSALATDGLCNILPQADGIITKGDRMHMAETYRGVHPETHGPVHMHDYFRKRTEE